LEFWERQQFGRVFGLVLARGKPKKEQL